MGKKLKDSMESRLDTLRQKVREKFDSEGEYRIGVAHTFSDAVILTDYETNKMYQVPYTELSGEITFGEPSEAEAVLVLKRMVKENGNMTIKEFMDFTGDDSSNKSAELTGPIVLKDNAERIAFAAVLVPGEPDGDFGIGEKILTKAEIERVANQWLADYGNIDLQHTLNNVATPVQSYITYSERKVVDKSTGDEIVLPEGTWILGSRHDEDTWEKIMKGELTGYSVMGIKRAALKSVLASTKNAGSPDVSLKRTLIKDLGDDWVAPYVSVVDEPCVPKAKWFALKSATPDAPEEEDKGLIAKVLQSLGVSGEASSEKVGRRVSEQRYEKIKNLLELMDNERSIIEELLKEAQSERKATGKSREEEDDLEEKRVKEIVEEAVKEALGKDTLSEVVKNQVSESLSDINEKLEALTTEEDGADEGATDDEGADDGGAEDDAGAEEPAVDPDVIDEILKRLDKFEKRGARPRSLKGQDGEEDAEATKGKGLSDRDIYGRKQKGVK